MQRLQVNVPNMYADHHVLRARAVLAALDGVADVVASAAFHTISLSYDSSLLTDEAIHAALTAAGYTPAPLSEPTLVVTPVTSKRGDPAWDHSGVRIARTDARDAKANR